MQFGVEQRARSRFGPPWAPWCAPQLVARHPRLVARTGPNGGASTPLSRAGGVVRSGPRLRLVFVSTEVAPWSKSGGLADVAAALPAALAARGHKVMTVSPLYQPHADIRSAGVSVPAKVPGGTARGSGSGSGSGNGSGSGAGGVTGSRGGEAAVQPPSTGARRRRQPRQRSRTPAPRQADALGSHAARAAVGAGAGASSSPGAYLAPFSLFVASAAQPTVLVHRPLVVVPPAPSPCVHPRSPPSHPRTFPSASALRRRPLAVALDWWSCRSRRLLRATLRVLRNRLVGRRAVQRGGRYAARPAGWGRGSSRDGGSDPGTEGQGQGVDWVYPIGVHGPGPSTPSSSSSSVVDSRAELIHFHSARVNGVDHVFIDHPLFSASSPPGMTYQLTGGSDMQARASLLCQAALAAPVLFWLPDSPARIWDGVSGSDGAPVAVGSAKAVLDGIVQGAGELPRSFSALEVALARLVVRHALSAGAGRSGVVTAACGQGATTSQHGEDALGQGQAMQTLQAAQGLLTERVSESEEEGDGTFGAEALGGSRVLNAGVLDTFTAGGDGSDGDKEANADAPLPVIFIANDWPTGLLPLWLDAYLDEKDRLSQSLSGPEPGAAGAGALWETAVSLSAAQPETTAGAPSAGGPGAGAAVAALAGELGSAGRPDSLGAVGGADVGRGRGDRSEPKTSSEAPSASCSPQVESRGTGFSGQPHGSVGSVREPWEGEGPVQGAVVEAASVALVQGAGVVNDSRAGRGSGPGRPGLGKPDIGRPAKPDTGPAQGPDGNQGLGLSDPATQMPRRGQRGAFGGVGEAAEGGDAGADTWQWRGRDKPGKSGPGRPGQGAAGRSAAVATRWVEDWEPDSVGEGVEKGVERAASDAESEADARAGDGTAAGSGTGATSRLSDAQEDGIVPAGIVPAALIGAQAEAPAADAAADAGAGTAASTAAGADAEAGPETSTVASATTATTPGAAPGPAPLASPGPDIQPLAPPFFSSSSAPAGPSLLERSLRSLQALVASKLSSARFVTVLHNFGVQGLFPADTFPSLGLPERHRPLLLTGTPEEQGAGSAVQGAQGQQGQQVGAPAPASLAPASSAPILPSPSTPSPSPSPSSPPGSSPSPATPPGTPAPPTATPGQQISWLQASLLCSDLLVTVSPRHAQELREAAAAVLQQGCLADWDQQQGGGQQGGCVVEGQQGLQGLQGQEASEGLGASAGAAVGGVLPSEAMALALTAGEDPALGSAQGGAGNGASASGGGGGGSGSMVLPLPQPPLLGILNGIDTSVWNPARDALLPPELHYDARSVQEGKARAKHMLQTRLGLRHSPSTPLFGFVGRLEEQKGADILLAALPRLLGPPRGPSRPHNAMLHCDPLAAAQAAAGGPAGPAGVAGGGAAAGATTADASALADSLDPAASSKGATAPAPAAPSPSPPPSASVPGIPLSVPAAAPPPPSPALSPTDVPDTLQLVMLGTGQPWIEQALPCLQSAYPGSAVGVSEHNEALAHLLMAGCDFLLVPSRYEPCGLVALCALQYGTVPIVTPLGGLLDIVDGALPVKQQRSGLAQEGVAPAQEGAVPAPAVRTLSVQGGVTAPAATAPVPQQEGAEASASDGPPESGEEQERAAAPGAAREAGVQGQGLGSRAHSPGADHLTQSLGPRAASLGYVLAAAATPSTQGGGDAVSHRRAVTALVEGMLAAARDYDQGRGQGFRALRQRCIQADVSWDSAVRQWERALKGLLG